MPTPDTITVTRLARLIGTPDAPLVIAAALALFRFKIGIIRTLLACSLEGVVLQLAFGGAL
jgi:hypothetical protein